MAAIGKIRSWGPVLVIIIGVALFAFIAGDLQRSCESSGQQRRLQVGEVLGEKLSVQDFQTLMDEFQDYVKVANRRDNLSEQELNQIKDAVWNTLINNKVIEKEAKKLGLTVTDEEMKNILREGTNPMLLSTPFVNPQTGRFDVNELSQFLNNYNEAKNTNPQVAEQYETAYKYWSFIEKNLRQQLLVMKYETLLNQTMLSNPVIAKADFDAANQQSDILLASMPYAKVNDNDVKVEDADIKAKYNEYKDRYKQDVETRDVKFVDFQVLPSAADRSALMKQMKEAQQQLAAGNSPAEVVRKAQSLIPYSGLFAPKAAFPTDIAAQIDSLAVGQTSAPFESRYDNTINVVKVVDKAQRPDTLEYRVIQVPGTSLDAVRKTADSIYTAINAGANFDSIATKYGQTATKQTVTALEIAQSANVMDVDTKASFAELFKMNVGQLKNMEFAQGNIIMQVTDKKGLSDKYDVAVVKHSIDFSKQTYSDAYNKFSQFVSENKTIEALEKNAEKYGFTVQEYPGMKNDAHYVANIRGTRDALKWIFDSKEGDVSPLYECGNNDHLLVIALDKINHVGYQPMESVKDELTNMVLRDKKFEKISEQLAGVKSIADAKAKGAQVDSIKMVTLANPVFVAATTSSEPALSGAVAAAKKGEFSGKIVKGQNGAFMLQVLDKKNSEAKFDAAARQQELQGREMQVARMFYLDDLRDKANIVDKRYLFF